MMRTLQIIITALFTLFMIQSCNAADGEMRVSMYVLVSPGKAAVFTKELASLVEQLGLKAELGGSTDDKGHTLYGLVAEGRGMSVWAQNVYIRRGADPAQCGVVVESYPDPGQYVVDVESGLSNVVAGVESGSTIASANSVTKLAKDIKDGLTNLGYEVRKDPVVCSSSAKSA